MAKSSHDDAPKLNGPNWEEWQSLGLPHLSIPGLVDPATEVPDGLIGGIQNRTLSAREKQEIVFLVEFELRPEISAATANAAWRALEMKYNKILQAQQLDLTHVVLIRPMDGG